MTTTAAPITTAATGISLGRCLAWARVRRQKGVLAFLAQDAAKRVFCYANAAVRNGRRPAIGYLFDTVLHSEEESYTPSRSRNRPLSGVYAERGTHAAYAWLASD